MFTFTDGTNELQQCFDLTLPLDNLLEQQEFIQLNAATPGSSSMGSVFILIADADGKHSTE